MVERSVQEVVEGLGRYTAVVNEPPWSSLSGIVRSPERTVLAGDMELTHLEQVAAVEPDATAVVVGIGGGTAMDTAKFVAWKTGRRLVLVPSIVSVDAAFTTAVGVRDEGRVRYVGEAWPDAVVLDIGLIRQAPRRLNRAGLGDVLSCHTALWDWQEASARGLDAPWRDDLAGLARGLLAELGDGAAEIGAVTPGAVRWLAGAHRSIGAACAEAAHARFEEGSEHFFAYAHEHATGQRHVHGELVAMAAVAVATIQDNDPSWVMSVLTDARLRAHPAELGISVEAFSSTLRGLRDYARRERLWHGVADFVDFEARHIDAAWRAVTAIPRTDG